MASKCREIERKNKVEGLVDSGLTARHQVLRTACSAQNALHFAEPSEASHPKLNHKKNPAQKCEGLIYGGERGIRTLDTLSTYTPLAGERLQPLGHLSGVRLLID